MSVWIVCVLCLAYAGVRYILLGPVPLDRAPAFILNKGVSLTGALLLAGGVLQRVRGADSRRLFESGSRFITLHLLLTFPLLAAGSFPALMAQGGHLNIWGQGMLLAGALAALLLWQEQRDRLRPAVLLLTAAHLLLLGVNGWLTPEKWHGGMPPITLIAFLATAGAALWCLASPRMPVAQPSSAEEMA